MEYRWIPGYEGIYDVNKEGDIRRHCKTKKVFIKKKKKKNGEVCVILSKNTVRTFFLIQKIMYLAYPEIIGEPKGKSKYLTFKNGMNTDTRVENIIFDTRANIKKRNSNKKSVIKVKNGEVVKLYKSVLETLTENKIHRSRMIELLKSDGKMTDTQGHSYYYEDLYYDRRYNYGEKRTRVTE